jgi:Ser/Thr protein kinase RdoA (MazF antagonist)
VKRPFRKLKGTSKANDAFAVANNRRPFVFNMTFADGSTVESQGSVKPEHCERLGEILVELHKISAKDEVIT